MGRDFRFRPGSLPQAGDPASQRYSSRSRLILPVGRATKRIIYPDKCGAGSAIVPGTVISPARRAVPHRHWFDADKPGTQPGIELQTRPRAQRFEDAQTIWEG